MRKINLIAILITSAMLFSIFPISVQAEETSMINDYELKSDEGVHTVAYDQEDVFEELTKQVEVALNERIAKENKFSSIINSNCYASDRNYTYRTVVVSTKNVWSPAGACGNQPSNGVRFPSGGGMYYNPSGGPAVSFSASINGTVIPLSVGIGISSSSSIGYYAEAPDKTNFYKLYARKLVTVQHVKTYRTNRQTGLETLYMETYPTTVSGFEFYLKKV